MIKISALLLLSLFISFFTLAQDYVVKWGALEKRTGRLISVLPKGGSDFYSLRWVGGALLGSYKISEHSNLTVSATGKLVMKVEEGIGNFEGARNVGGKLIVFISDKKDGKNNLFIQEYSKDLLPQGSVKALASFDLEKNKSRGFFDVINSRNNDFFGVIWEIPGKKEEKDKYGFKIFDKAMNELSEGDYKMPFEGNLSSIHQHYLSNTGDYFISVVEYSEGDKKLFRKYLNYKAMHIFHINPDGIEEFTLSLEGKRVEALTMNSDNERIMTLTGIYGDQGKAGVSGLFYLRADFDKQEVIDEGFEKFGKDFITQDWSDRDKEKAEKRENKGKGEPQLYDYVMRQAEVLKDGSIVGSIEQYYIVVNTYTDPRTGSTRTTYTYYYNDIIAFKVNTDGEFDWLRRINKSQVSTNDGGPYSSYARFVDNGKICFIFNDNVRNYDETGKFIGKSSSEVYAANYGKKKNVVAIVELDMDEGELTRKTFFDRQEISAIAVPKQFYIDYNTKEMLVYAVYGKKEKFGILKFND